MNSFRTLCTPSEHRLSRRRLLGTAAGAGVAVGTLGLGGLLQPSIAEECNRDSYQRTDAANSKADASSGNRSQPLYARQFAFRWCR